jgi:hypothetical protein
MRFKISLLVLLSLVLLSCLSPQLANWPESIPAMRVFEQSYAEDGQNQRLQSRQEYLEWVMVFYQGNLLYTNGWSDLNAYLHTASTRAQGEVFDAQLAVLGRLIAAEWSKDNSLRRIDNRMLSLWGSVVQSAPTPVQQQLAVQVIQQDVDSLLAGKLSALSIRELRYEEKLDIDLFDGF